MDLFPSIPLSTGKVDMMECILGRVRVKALFSILTTLLWMSSDPGRQLPHTAGRGAFQVIPNASSDSVTLFHDTKNQSAWILACVCCQTVEGSFS